MSPKTVFFQCYQDKLNDSPGHFLRPKLSLPKDVVWKVPYPAIVINNLPFGLRSSAAA